MNYEFLKPFFENDLNASANLVDGELLVNGASFSTSDILRKLDNPVYNDAFEEWLEERNDELLLRADEIIANGRQEKEFSALMQTINKTESIPFIGAGIACSAGFPTWTGFLRDLHSKSTMLEAEFNALINSGKFEEIAEQFYMEAPEHFNHSVEITFREGTCTSMTIPYLPEIFNDTSVITTNFDKLLEPLFPNNTVRRGAEIREATRNMSAGTRLLVKLHGDHDLQTGRVLTQTEYNSAYGHDDAVLCSFWESIMLTKSLLFLGCSLSVDRTIKAMESIVAKKPLLTAHNYAFLPYTSATNQNVKSRELSKANIFPIWYDSDKFDHDDAIEALLAKIYKEKQ